jgi:hypothetical protein
MEYADPQLMSNLSAIISDSNLSVLLNQSTKLFNTVCHSWSGQMAQAVLINDACSATGTPSFA